jgi:hypothetical protein
MRDKRIQHLERDPDIFVTLKAGWQYDGAHCFGEDSMADVRETMKSVTRCTCEQCKAEKART